MTQSAQGGRMELTEDAIEEFRCGINLQKDWKPFERMLGHQVCDAALLALRSPAAELEATKPCCTEYKTCRQPCIPRQQWQDGGNPGSSLELAKEFGATDSEARQMATRMDYIGKGLALAKGGQGGEVNDQRESAGHCDRSGLNESSDSTKLSEGAPTGASEVVSDRLTGANQSDSHPTGQGAQSAVEQCCGKYNSCRNEPPQAEGE